MQEVRASSLVGLYALVSNVDNCGHRPLRLHCSVMFESLWSSTSFLRSKTPEERPSAQQALNPVTCRCPVASHGIHGTAGVTARMVRAPRGGRAREVCAFVASSEPPLSHRKWQVLVATKIGFQFLLCDSRPAGRAVSSSGRGVLFLLTRSSTVFAKFWQLKTHPLKNL